MANLKVKDSQRQQAALFQTFNRGNPTGTFGRGPSVGRPAGFSGNRTFGRRLRREADGQVMVVSERSLAAREASGRSAANNKTPINSRGVCHGILRPSRTLE